MGQEMALTHALHFVAELLTVLVLFHFIMYVLRVRSVVCVGQLLVLGE